MKLISKKLSAFIIIFSGSILVFSQDPYTGKPYNNQPQLIPGKIECEFFDLGGENVAYHDTDSVNNGSGKLNPVNGTYLNEFRIKDGVDISYTKTNGIDNNPYNIVEPKMEQLYVGWTVPGEWINYSVNITKSGTYQLGIMYTCNGNGVIGLSLDNNDVTTVLNVITTHNDLDTVAWRQWHHWNKIDSLTSIKLEAGNHILTLKTLENGNINYDYLEFKEVK